MKKTFILILFAFLVSCDIFDTRDPENPDTGRSNNLTATTPDILFSNLINSFSEKIPENYSSCFVDTSFLKRRFNFIPSAGSISQFPSLLQWGPEAEDQYFRNVINLTPVNTPITLSLNNIAENIFGDSAIYQIEYNLIVPFESQMVYGGTAKFKIFRDSRTQWVIVEWEDIKKEGSSSWSELKGSYY